MLLLRYVAAKILMRLLRDVAAEMFLLIYVAAEICSCLDMLLLRYVHIAVEICCC